MKETKPYVFLCKVVKGDFTSFHFTVMSRCKFFAFFKFLYRFFSSLQIEIL